MKSQRLDMIEEYVLEHKNASLDTLCEKFNVSKNTIRRDVDILLKRGSIMKVYGGVAALETPQTLPLLSYEERGGRFPEEKKEICRRAAELVAEDDTIYIDTGTTCLNLVDFIADKHCTILTNSLLIFNKAASYPNLDIISVPGKLNRKTLSFTGPDINDYLQTYNISMAFMACTGVTMKSGLTNASAEEYITKKAIAENANSMILLADHSKFGRISLMTYSPMEKLDAMMTRYYENHLMTFEEIEDFNRNREKLVALTKNINRIIGVYYEQLDFIIETYITRWIGYGFDDNTLTLIATYCFKRGVRTLEGMNDVVEKFYKQGLISAESIDQFIGKSVENDNFIKAFFDEAGITRNVTSRDRDSYKVWTSSWGMTNDLIMLAAQKAKGNVSPVSYMNTLLSAWFKAEEAKAYKFEKSTATETKVTKTYTSDQLNAMFDNLDYEDL